MRSARGACTALGPAGPQVSSRGGECLGLQVPLRLPWRKTGEPPSGDGACRNPPPTAGWVRPAWGTREPWEEGEGPWRVGQREPNDTPDVLTGVGWGPGVGAQESWAHQEEDCRRRPLAFGKTGPKADSGKFESKRLCSYNRGTTWGDVE